MKLPDYRQYKLISVDIFDTLLFRVVAKAVDLFELAWNEAQKRGYASLAISSKEYMKFRVEMERRAREYAVNREVTLDDIYRQFPDFIASDIDQLKALEILCEKRYCYANLILLKWLADAKNFGCRLVLVSDMYLSSDVIKEILEYNQIDTAMFDEILVSNEAGCNKQDGALFDILLQRNKEISAGEILHIGDNKNADYEQPLKKGLNAFHYNVTTEKTYSIYDYEKIRHNVPQPGILSLRKLAASVRDYSGSEKTAYEIGSSVIGPVLALYVSWVCQRLKKSGIKRIYPLMREGHVLGKLLQRESDVWGMGLVVHPIYISRKVTYIPSIRNVNREEIENMIGARNLTIRESAQLMGLEQERFEEYREYFDVQYKETHKIPYQNTTLKEKIIEKFLEEENSKDIKKYIQQERKKLVSYLIQEIGNFDNIATIDIGFFGRIQMWMQECLDLENISYNMKHFFGSWHNRG